MTERDLRMTTFRMQHYLREAVDAAAKAAGFSRSAFIRRGLKRELERSARLGGRVP